MFRRGKGMVLLALGIALLVGVMLYLLSHKTPLALPVPREQQTVQGFWADDLRDRYGGIDYWEGATPSDEGLRLSQLQPLHSLDPHNYSYSSLMTGSGANIYGRIGDLFMKNDSFFVYNVDQRTFESLPLPFSGGGRIRSLTVAPGDRLYGVAEVSEKDARLFPYDPDTRIVRDLSALMPFSEIWAISNLTIAPDERLYGVVEVGEQDARLFTYHPSTDTARDLGVLIPFSQVRGVSDLTIAPDGRLYGVATVSEWDDARLFVYDSRTNEVRDLGAFVGGRWIINLVAGADSRIHGYVQVGDFDPMLFSYDPSLDKVTPVKISAPIDLWNYAHDQLILGNDGVLYGTIERSMHHTVFALNLDNGAVITQALPGRIRVLIPRPDDGVYLGTGQGLWTFDLTGKSLVELPQPLGATALAVNKLIARGDGRLYGCGAYNSCFPGSPCSSVGYFLFTFAPSSGEFKKLEYLDCWRSPLVIGSDDRIYTTIKPKEEHLVSLELGMYTRVGIAQSDPIEPISLVLTRASVGDLDDDVRALVCGHDGRIYGVIASRAYSNEPGWLFKYDPGDLENTVERFTPDVSERQGGTTLVQLDDGRLVGGTRGGHLFVYDPATGETWDVGQPVSDTVEIAALALGRDGLVYGGTTAYYQQFQL